MHRGKVEPVINVDPIKYPGRKLPFFYADCSCGWQSDDCRWVNQAQAELDEHLKEVG